MSYRGRFAPSPTGALHFGSLVAAVGSWVRARSQGGTWLVRMEDLDPPREVPGSAAQILQTLAAFGMSSDEPVLYQSKHESAYRAAFEELQALGVVFPCWCSRNDLDGEQRLHRGVCVAPPDAGREPAWRLRTPDVGLAFCDAVFGKQRQILGSSVGDFVVRRVEGWYAYQLAVVVDDAAQAITEVVRGADLLDSTPRQIHLQHLLGLPTPDYLHLPVVFGDDGRKLSKQDRARPVDANDPMPALRAALAFLGLPDISGTDPDGLLGAAVREFDIAHLAAAQANAAAQGGTPHRYSILAD
ncbi:MAG TPA: tRNA glutamyl-Q(34) synthetase GluQRS [Rudaea sp.]|jgi:glutamyl-Q tRNA(Asp) synthetase